MYLHIHSKLDTYFYEILYSDYSILPPPKIYLLKHPIYIYVYLFIYLYLHTSVQKYNVTYKVIAELQMQQIEAPSKIVVK